MSFSQNNLSYSVESESNTYGKKMLEWLTKNHQGSFNHFNLIKRTDYLDFSIRSSEFIGAFARYNDQLVVMTSEKPEFCILVPESQWDRWPLNKRIDYINYNLAFDHEGIFKRWLARCMYLPQSTIGGALCGGVIVEQLLFLLPKKIKDKLNRIKGSYTALLFTGCIAGIIAGNSLQNYLYSIRIKH